MANLQWLKLSTDFFDNNKIKLIESEKDGDTLIRVWIQFLTIAMKCNYQGRLSITEDKPMTVEEFSKIMGKSKKKITKCIEKFEELKENNIKLINLYQTDSIYNKLVEDEELTYNTIDNADELNGKFIFKDEYSKLLLFEIKYIFFDIIRNLSEYNKMIELKKDSEKGYNED